MSATALRRIALAAYAIALTAAAMSRLVPIIRDQLVAPFDLISEGPHLDVITAVRDGFNIYAPETRAAPPFHITPYVPLFHALVAILPAHPTNPFFTGRLVTMLFMFAAAAGVFAITRSRHCLSVPLIAFACFFLIRPVTGSTAYIRSDPAGLFFSIAAVISVARRTPTVRTAVLAGALCGVAFACKQSFLAASLTCFAYLALRNPRLALTCAAAEAAVLGILGVIATVRWGRGFWYCVLLPANGYPRDWPSFIVHWQDMFTQPIFTFIVAMVLLTWAIARRRGTVSFAASPYPLYVLTSFVVQSLALSGIGASNHYFFEPVLASLLWLVWVSTPTNADRRRDWALAAALVVLGLCVGRELYHTVPGEYRYTTATQTAEHVRNRDWVIAEMARRGIPQRRLLNLKNSPVTFDYPGEMSINDPYLFFVLWDTHQISTEPLLRAIRDRYFDAVFVNPQIMSGEGQSPDYPIQNVFRVLFQHYALAIQGADVSVLTPQPSALLQGR